MSRTAAALLLLALVSRPALAAAPEVATPEVVFAAPARWAALARELRKDDGTLLAETAALVGLAEPGPPIRVVLAEEGSREARLAPSWGVGYAFGAAGRVVLLPYRVPAYPDDSLAAVLHHELAHVLVARAARRRPVPRWFDEGVALYAAREWRLGDRSRVLWATLRHGDFALARIDRDFDGGRSSAERAYALSGAFVRYLIDDLGPGAVARILDGVGEGRSFHAAFRGATGKSLADVEARFRRHLGIWNRWVPFLTSSFTLWILVTGLALWAFKRRRERDAALRERWQVEEAMAQLAEHGPDA